MLKNYSNITSKYYLILEMNFVKTLLNLFILKCLIFFNSSIAFQRRSVGVRQRNSSLPLRQLVDRRVDETPLVWLRGLDTFTNHFNNNNRSNETLICHHCNIDKCNLQSFCFIIKQGKI